MNAFNDVELVPLDRTKAAMKGYWMLTGKTHDLAVFYCKSWTKEPSRKTVRMLKDRYDNKYGAYLSWELKKV